MSRRRAKSRKPSERAASAGSESRSTGAFSGRRRFALAAAAGLAFVALAIAVLALLRRDTGEIALPPPAAAPALAVVSAADFAGAERCAECHASQYDAWRTSTHGLAGGPPAPDLLIAPFDGRPIRFRDAVVIPERNAAGDYVFTVAREDRPGAVLRVDGVIGGGHMVGGGTQGFVTRFADGTWRFLPFDWSRDGGVWFCNTGTRAERGWLPITPDLRLADCGDWPPVRVLGTEPRLQTCQQCHGSRIDIALDEDGSGYRTSIGSLAIDCESCHGPGRAHVEFALAGRIMDAPDPAIGVLGALDTDASLGVCFQCHALKDQIRSGYLPGHELTDYYSIALPLLGESALHADGRVRTFAYQETHLFSECYRNGSMTCVDCHDPHASSYRDVWSRPLASRFDDMQCLSCHPSKATDVERHTRHPADSPGSRCVTCHMPYLQHPEVGDAVRYARSDHTIPVPRPALEAALGVTGACAQCHADWQPAELQRRVDALWGEAKPLHPAVAALVTEREPSAAALEAAVLAANERHAIARYLALARLFERHMALDVAPGRALERTLRALAHSDDVDAAALALAALHLTRGEDRGTRRLLADALERRGRDEHALRTRWGTALGFRGDRLRERGEAAAAEAAYRRGLEVTPDDPRLHERIALTLADRARFADAIPHYERSLAIEPRQALVLVNLGIAQNALGDAAGAVAAYERALAVNAAEPLAWFNLGNVYYRAGDWARAAQHYRRAAELDGGNPAVHFNLARALLQVEDLDGAAAALDAGLEFEPENVGARQLREELARAGAGAR
jgi:tetratricopeptide (TPR) repeat protein